MLAEPHPRGFEVEVTDLGICSVRYRTSGMKGAGCFLACWLSIWTVGCVFGTYRVLIDGWAHWLLIAWLIPGWAAEIFVIGYALWFFWSVTTFKFGPDELVAERSLLRYRRERIFPRATLKEVVQVKDGGDGEDSFPSWGLVVVGEQSVKVLSRQRIEASTWLGPVIARWAGVSFTPWKPPSRNAFESL